METFFKIFFVWPFKIAFFMVMLSIAICLSILVIVKLASRKKDGRPTQEGTYYV